MSDIKSDAYDEINSILERCSTEDANTIVSNLYKEQYTKILSDEFNYLVENDSEVQYMVVKIYKLMLLEYIVNTNGTTVDRVKFGIDNVDIKMTKLIDNTRTVIIQNFSNGCYDDIMKYPTQSNMFKRFFRSKVIKHLTDASIPFKKYYNDVKFL